MSQKPGKLLAIFGVFVAALSFAAVNAEKFLLDHYAGKIPKQTLSERQAFLEPTIRISKPAIKRDQYPVVIQFHGCAGHRDDFMAHWATIARNAGFMAVSVDSNGPRGFDYDRSLEIVCTGKALLGQERAGDIVAAIDLIAKRPDVDPSKIVIAGWSHGAWSVMDMLAMDRAKRPPAGLVGPNLTLPTLAGVILFYPYCGQGAWSRITSWGQTPPTLALIAGKDTIVNGPECKKQMQKLNKAGANINVVYYPDADHVFDDPTQTEPPYDYYDAPTAENSIMQFRSFLKSVESNR